VAAAVILSTVASAHMLVHPHREAPLDLPPVRWSHRAKPGSNIPEHLLGEVASATIMLHESLFSKITNAVLPAIIAEARLISIPGKKEKHFSYGDVTLKEFNIGGVTISFEAPNVVVVKLTDLSLATPSTDFDLFAKVLFVHVSCRGTFDVALSKTDVRIKFAFDDNNGVLGITNIDAEVDFGNLDIHHAFHDLLCKIGQDIVQLFVGNIDNVIRNAVAKDISPIMTKVLTKAFTSLAARMRLPIVSAPVATSDSISFDVDLMHRTPPHASRRRAHRRSPPRATLLRNSTFPARDIEVLVPQTSVNVILASVHIDRVIRLNDTTDKLKHFLPAAYAACPNCPLEIEVNLQNAPTAQLSGGAALSVSNALIGVNAINGSQTVDLLDLLLNATALATNFSVSGDIDNDVKFAIAVPTFAVGLQSSGVGPIDTSLLTWLGNLVIQDFIVPDFNRNFHGIPIGPIANVTVSQIEIAFPNAADVGLDITIPPLAQLLQYQA